MVQAQGYYCLDPILDPLDLLVRQADQETLHHVNMVLFLNPGQSWPSSLLPASKKSRVFYLLILNAKVSTHLNLKYWIQTLQNTLIFQVFYLAYCALKSEPLFIFWGLNHGTYQCRLCLKHANYILLTVPRRYFFCGSFICFFCLVFVMPLCASVYLCLVGKGSTSWLTFVVSNCEFFTFPLVSWVLCGTWLYRFLNFAPLRTLLIEAHICKGVKT